MSNKVYDVVIIGGSYAGLSAALALGRALRNVLVVDGGRPCNRYTPHSHNFLTQDGETPGEIIVRARKDLQHYSTVAFSEDIAITVVRSNDTFALQTVSGNEVFGRKLIFATGLRDNFPDIKGFEECWGKSVIHCPYCHGYEYANEVTGIIGNGNDGYYFAELLWTWTKNIIIFPNGSAAFNAEQLTKIKKHNIQIIESEIQMIIHEGGNVRDILTKDGRLFPVKAIYCRPKNTQHSDIPQALGCEINDQGLLKVDDFRRTTVMGVYACGDNSSFRSVAMAVSTGSLAGAMVNRELAADEF